MAFGGPAGPEFQWKGKQIRRLPFLEKKIPNSLSLKQTQFMCLPGLAGNVNSCGGKC